MNRKNAYGIICLLCCVCLIFPSCRNATNERYSETYIEYFDTVTTVIVYGVSEKDFEKFKSLFVEKAERYHRLFDIYNNYDGVANIKTINDNAAKKAVSVDPELIGLLSYSKMVHEMTAGYVNIAMGSVLKLWRDCGDMAKISQEDAGIPDPSELRKANLHTNINNIVIDQEKNEVYISDAETSIDVGAIAKGYAAQKISDFLKNEGYENFVLNLGGNVVTCGEKEGGSKWQIAIEDPSDTTKTLCALLLSDKSLVTSGSYQRYYTVDGYRYHHIIHPILLAPRNIFLSVSVVSDDSALADALSTALFNMTYDEGSALVDSLDDVEAMWVLADGGIMYSENFKSYIAEG